jgi:hypothetical protein
MSCEGVTMEYQLHDCEIDAVILDNNKIIFSFPNGFYVVDENRQELRLTRKKLVFIIDIDKDSFPNETLESNITIRRINWRMNGWKEISFKQFSSLFKKGNMVIHDEYDSKLTNWKMIQLNACTKCGNIEMFITDIKNVTCWE